MRKQIKIRIQLHSYMRTKQITKSTYMKKQILLTNYYTMTTIKVTSESFYSITEDCLADHQGCRRTASGNRRTPRGCH